MPAGRDTRVDVKFTKFSLKLGALPALSLPLDLFSPTGALFQALGLVVRAAVAADAAPGA